MDAPSRIEGDVPSPALQARLEYEAQRIDFNLRVDASHNTHVSHTDFEPRPHLILQMAGAGQTVETSIPEADATAEFRLVEPDINDDEAEPVKIDGDVFGLIAENRLYVLFDLAAIAQEPGNLQVDGDIAPEDAVGRIFEAVVGHGLERILEHIERYNYERELDDYIDSKLQGLRDDVRSWEQDLRDTRSQMSRASDRVERLSRECSNLRDKIQAFEAHADTTIRERIEGEFEALLKMMPDPIEHLRVVSRTLRLYTRPVKIEYEGSVYPMGRYRIEVPLRNVDLRIHAHENNQRVEEHFHPHILPDGSPCWGNVGPGISQLLGERQIAEAMPIVWRFLNSYSAEAPYVGLENYDAENAAADSG